MSVINTNFLALVSQNNLSRSQGALGTAIERLSSGMRINSAKDDAAGQAIANRFTANIRGLTQAARNANDGISIAQTTEGSLNEVNENLQRIREQVVQALNGSNSDSDLRSIQAEINERLGEINRISEETQFNGKYVLGEHGESLTIQVGAHDNQTITIDLRAINTETLNLEGFSVADGIDADAVGSAAVSNVTAQVAYDLGDLSGATPPSGGEFGNTLYIDGSGNYYIEVTDATSSAANGFYAVTVGSGGALTSVATSVAGVSAGDVTATSTVGIEVAVNYSGEGEVRAYSGTEAGAPDYVIVEGSGDDARYFAAVVAEDGTVTAGRELSVGGATPNPLEALDAALQQVDDLRSHLGAIQNRFESTVANLNNTVNNLSAARSRIEDADYAVEVSNLTRAQILQQAGTSVLAQANQIPQTVLSLLR